MSLETSVETKGSPLSLLEKDSILKPRYSRRGRRLWRTVGLIAAGVAVGGLLLASVA